MNSISMPSINSTRYRKQKCCICGKPFIGYGNNPAPIKHKGRCCDACNGQMVIPSRLLRCSLGLDPRGD